MDLADPAHVLALDEHAAAATRMEKRLLPRNDLDGGAELPGQRLQHGLDRVEVRLHRLAAPRPGPKRARRDRRDTPGLVGRRGPLADEPAGQHAVVGRAPLAQVGAPGLEQGDPLRAVRSVVAAASSSEPISGRSLDGVLGGERIGDADRLGRDVAVGNPEPAGHAGVGETEVDDRVEAKVAHRVLGPAAQALLAGQPAGLPARDRQRGRAGSSRSRGCGRPPRSGRPRG